MTLLNSDSDILCPLQPSRRNPHHPIIGSITVGSRPYDIFFLAVFSADTHGTHFIQELNSFSNNPISRLIKHRYKPTIHR